jgi:hypothetical protein
MKTIRFFSLAFASILMMGGCATVKVVTDIKSGTDFSNYRTFKVVHFVNEEVQQTQNFRVNQINRERIEQAIAINAEQRGMKKAESDPDVVLLWATDVNIEESYSSHTTYAGGGYWGYRGAYYMGGPSYTTTDVNKYYIGKLTIAIVESGSEELLWYGQGTKDISGDAGRAEETINLIVGKIMETFPIGSTGE